MANKDDYYSIGWDWDHVVPVKVRCKHGHYSCDRCGTNNDTDVMHTTINGIGKVGDIFKKK